ncbi:MAG TPA: Fur family transcriptional regulator [Candidatus Saccharimonadia bacterium]|nr:Fur family transcriptional regulator [Candidatus Saccharimonadia bacterium]
MLDKFKAHLRANGHSLTPGRLAIFGYLQQHDPTTLAALIKAQPTLDRASIYRSISLFKDLEIVQDIISGGHKQLELTDRFDDHHHHLSCVDCGLSTTIEDEALERRLDQLARAHGLQPISHQIEVSGRCRACQNRRAGT